jgi:hypothetical protein
MKKVLSVIILLAFFGSMIIMTGCFGGSDGIGAILAGAAFVLVITASGGSGAAAAFAANTKANLRSNISINSENINMKVYPLNLDGSKDTANVQTIASGSLATSVDANGKIQFRFDVPSNLSSFKQFQVEVYNGANLMTKGIRYVSDYSKSGDVPIEVNATSTAKVLLYEDWTTSSDYSDFEYTLQKSGANLDAVATKVDEQLNLFPTNKTVNYTTIKTDASYGSALTTVNTSTQYTNKVVVYNPSPNPQVMAFGTEGRQFSFENSTNVEPSFSEIGLSFFLWNDGTGYQPRLGNYFHFYPLNNQTSQEQVIAYAGASVTALDQANTVPSVWYTNSLQAKGSALAEGDVYYFRVKKENLYMYGAIKIGTITTYNNEYIITYHYKYNREYGNTNLNMSSTTASMQ